MNLAEMNTVMVLREQLMAYFKGDVTQVMRNTVVRLSSVDEPRGQYTYQRRLQQLENKKHIRISGQIVGKVSKAPDTITFYTGILNGSSQLRFVYAEIEKFLDEYLPNVKREYHDGNVSI